MRIAMVAPLEVRVPPLKYGGTELVTSLLSEELVRRGHKVTLFASGDSITTGQLVSVVKKSLWSSKRSGSPPVSLLNMVQALESSSNFDIIHNHTTYEGLATAGLVSTPFLTTLHGNLEGDMLLLFKRYRAWYNTISKSAKRLLPPKDRFAGVIYNAIDCSKYPFNCGDRDDYLLFLSRLSPEKGAHIAIDVARRLNTRLVIAGAAQPPYKEYFQGVIQPKIDGKLITYESEVSHQRKKDLLAHAKCLLAPVTWPEPFGLFMVEALACGTPVVALNQGSTNEIVVNGKTGFVVESVDEMIDAVKMVGRIDPTECRSWATQNFDVPILADNYLNAYERVIEAEKKKAAMAESSLIMRE